MKPAPRVKPQEIDTALLAPLPALEAKVAAALEATEAKVDAIDRGRLKPEIITADERRIRAALGPAIAAELAQIQEADDALAAQRIWYDAPAIRARAAFATDPVQSATLELAYTNRLRLAPLHELVELAREAAATERLAAVEAIKRELYARNIGATDDTGRRILELCAACPLPAYDLAVAERIDQARKRIALLHVEARESLTGRADPVGKLSIGYGNLEQPKPTTDTDGDLRPAPVDRLAEGYAAS